MRFRVLSTALSLPDGETEVMFLIMLKRPVSPTSQVLTLDFAVDVSMWK